MMKGFLLTLILFAGGAAGHMLSGGRGRRSNLLNGLLAALRVLRLRMLNSQEALSVLLRRSEAALFRKLGEEMQKGTSLAECWQSLRLSDAKRGCMLDSLSEGDLSLLDELFNSLGGSGREEQNELISSIILRLEEACGEARRSYRDASRTCTALGALAGAGVCILMI